MKFHFFLILFITICQYGFSKSVLKEMETPLPIHFAFKGSDGAKLLLDHFDKCQKATEKTPQQINNKSFDNPTDCYLFLLPNSDSETTVKDITKGTNVSILTNTASVKKKSYEITMTWKKYTWM
ncbi:MAG: hypothetical protein OXE99_08345, partial [Cellvibrionales bacterium]|nr:hypothetical protein [Cellvibrionales bacterium]